MELTLDQALQKGVEAHKAGKFQEAERYYTAILKTQPKHPDANHNMGVLAVGVGKVESALPFFKTALEVNQTIDQFWLSYIDALIKLNRIDDAKAVLDQAKSNGIKGVGVEPLKDRIAELGKDVQVNGTAEKSEEPRKEQLQNLINLYTQGQYQTAQTQASQLLKQFPKSVNLYNIIGATDKELGNLNEAIEAYNKALSIRPNVAEIYSNMGNALQDQGKLDEAIEAYSKALSIKPDYAEASYNIGNALKSVTFKKPNRNLQKIIVSLLDKESLIRPKEIAKSAISLLKLEPTLQKHLQSDYHEIIQDTQGIISDLSNLSLLLKLMNVCPVPDLEIENLLKNLRHAILSDISSLKEASLGFIGVQSAIALQCYTNEYIYSHTEEEEKILKSLDSSVRKTLESNEQPSPQLILALASYKALNEYDWYKLLAVTDHIRDVFVRQIEEPNQEKKIKIDLPVLSEITEKVSLEVRAQYEESPYPRWVNLGLSLRSMTTSEVFDVIGLKLHSKKITEVEKPDILIAGCGTGQHSIGTAARFKYSKVLAIDLSLSSLAYAKRKTDELGIGNIEYMQADILDLRKLNKQFDIIESSGVLHHMDNPMAGWTALKDCLKPYGLIKIGLYSEIARQHIVKIRQEISKSGIGSSDAAMKSFRTMVMESDQNHHKQILNSKDFYSLSTLKDLLFHVQEHRLTIPQVKEYLKKLGLKFCGFETQTIVSHFMQTNKATEELYDLDKWQAYEEANPKAFAGMYQFWCQKVG